MEDMVYPAGNVKTAREEVARFDLPAFLRGRGFATQ